MSGPRCSALHTAPFVVGEEVNALYTADGIKYPARIRKVYRSKRQYLVDWADGDSTHRAVRFEDVSARPRKARRAAQAGVAALPRPSPTCTDGDSAVEKLAGDQNRAALSCDADDDHTEIDQVRWDSSRLAQLFAEVGHIPVKHSSSYWSQVAERMRLIHNMRNAQPTECQQAYASRFPTPTKRRNKTAQSKQKETEDRVRQLDALDAGAGASHARAQTVPAHAAEPDGSNEETSLRRYLRPAIRPPRPGTIKWKSYVRAVLAESDRNHIDDVFAHPNDEENAGSICSTSAIRAVEATAAATVHDNGHDLSDADKDIEEEHDFLTSVTEQQRRDMDGYLALLQRRDKGGSVFRGAKGTGKTR
eukprot:COSAG02_NODE_8589_length_2512_cov_3.300870_1_plen_362_part_00